jgi:hypothetical protein
MTDEANEMPTLSELPSLPHGYTAEQMRDMEHAFAIRGMRAERARCEKALASFASSLEDPKEQAIVRRCWEAIRKG